MSKNIDDFFAQHPQKPDKVKFLDTDVDKLKQKDLVNVAAWAMGEVEKMEKQKKRHQAMLAKQYVSRSSLL